MLKALKLLPTDYFLVINGSSHPRDLRRECMRSILDFIDNNKLQERVCFAGALNDYDYESVNFSSDIVVFPYQETGLIGSGNLALSREQSKTILASDIQAFRESETYYQNYVNYKSPVALFDRANHCELAHLIIRHEYNNQCLADNRSQIPTNMYDFCRRSLNIMNFN
jgi:glycosyltransferase involved in cell wall biosynthesis